MPKQGLPAIVSLAIFLLTLPSFLFAAETITITTYYPSPAGSFNTLTTTGNTYLATSSGSVGIGTTGPVGLLDVYKSQSADTAAFINNVNAGTAAEATLYVSNAATGASGTFIGTGGTGFTTASGFVQDGGWVGTGSALSGGLSIMTRASAPIRFYTNGHTNERVRIDENGNVGIGTTGPTASLHLYKASGAGIILEEGAANDVELSIKNTVNEWQIYTAGADGALRFWDNGDKVVINGGNVGIGTTSPTLGPLQMGSGAYVTSGGVWTDASSRAYKQDIIPLSLNKAMKALTHLKPVTFRYKRAPDEQHVGFISEDVPELVVTKDRTGLSPMDIVAVLTKVVQQQQKEIETLKQEVSGLKRAL